MRSVCCKHFPFCGRLFFGAASPTPRWHNGLSGTPAPTILSLQTRRDTRPRVSVTPRFLSLRNQSADWLGQSFSPGVLRILQPLHGFRMTHTAFGRAAFSMRPPSPEPPDMAALRMRPYRTAFTVGAISSPLPKTCLPILCHPERSRGIYFLSYKTDLSIRCAQSR